MSADEPSEPMHVAARLASIRLLLGRRGILPGALFWTCLLAAVAAAGGVNAVEQPLGDAIDRRLEPPALAGRAWVVQLTDGPERALQAQALLARAARDGVEAVAVLTPWIARALGEGPRSEVRIVLATRLEPDASGALRRRPLLPESARGPGLEGAVEGLLDFPHSAIDGTWRRVAARRETADGSGPSVAACLLGEIPATTRLRALLSTRLTTLPARRLLSEGLTEAPWRGGVWILTTSTPQEHPVWTAAQEELPESLALALAVEGIASGCVLYEPHPLALALLVFLVTVAASFLAFLRRRALLALCVVVAALAAGVVLTRAIALVSLPCGPLLVSPLVGLTLGLARLEWVRQRSVDVLAERLRQALARRPLSRSRGEAEPLDAVRRLLEAAAVARLTGVRGQRRLLLSTAPGVSRQLLGEVLGAAVVESTEGSLELPGFPAPATILSLGADDLLVVVPPEQVDALTWWQARSERAAAAARALLDRQRVERDVASERGGGALERLGRVAERVTRERSFLQDVVARTPGALLVSDALGLPVLRNAAHERLEQRLSAAGSDLVQFLATVLRESTAEATARVVAALETGRPTSFAAHPLPHETLDLTLTRLDPPDGAVALLLHVRAARVGRARRDR